MSYLLAFLGFAALILLHEFGHFAAAKAVGMRVERFSLFLGPLVLKRRRGETEYGIAAIPLGGYVKITGMNPEEELKEETRLAELRARLEELEHGEGGAGAPGEEERELRSQIDALSAEASSIRRRAYYNQPVWKRIVVIAAGPGVNLLLAFLIIFVLIMDYGTAVPTDRVGGILHPSAAAGVLHLGDRIVSVDGVGGGPEVIRTQIDRHRCAGPQRNGCSAAQPATIVLRRHGALVTVRIRPRYDASVGRMLVGFDFGTRQVPIGAGSAAHESVTWMWSVTTSTVSTIAKIFEPQGRQGLHSVVGAYTVTQQYFAKSPSLALQVLALISLSLAIINLFPFLPLDGGHIFWAVAEKLRGKRIPFEVMERAGFVGLALIVMLFVIGFSNDINTLTGKGFGIH